MNEEITRYYKALYGFENWNVAPEREISGLRTFSLHLSMGSTYQRVSQEVTPPMWGESLYTHSETLRKGNVDFCVKLWPYHTTEKAKEGMLERMIASVPFEKAEDIHIGDLCYTHPIRPYSYLLFLSSKTMVEITVYEEGNHMDDIKELASIIVAQMNDVRNRMLTASNP